MLFSTIQLVFQEAIYMKNNFTKNFEKSPQLSTWKIT